MHYSAIVIIDADPRGSLPVAERVEREMNPHTARESEETGDLLGFFDWYQIGGRWTGAFDSTYDPAADARNTKRCEFCNATGTRHDGIRLGRKEADFTCLACDGTGTRVKWPTQFAPFVGDVAGCMVAAETDWAPHTLLVDGEAYHVDDVVPINSSREERDWPTFIRTTLEAHPLRFAVVVDYHN